MKSIIYLSSNLFLVLTYERKECFACSRKEIAPYRTALDDSCTVAKFESKTFPIPMVTWTQIIVRHIFGKHSWYMRSLKDFHDDFGAGDLLYFVCLVWNSFIYSSICMYGLKNLTKSKYFIYSAEHDNIT